MNIEIQYSMTATYIERDFFVLHMSDRKLLIEMLLCIPIFCRAIFKERLNWRVKTQFFFHTVIAKTIWEKNFRRWRRSLKTAKTCWLHRNILMPPPRKRSTFMEANDEACRFVVEISQFLNEAKLSDSSMFISGWIYHQKYFSKEF